MYQYRVDHAFSDSGRSSNTESTAGNITVFIIFMTDAGRVLPGAITTSSPSWPRILQDSPTASNVFAFWERETAASRCRRARTAFSGTIAAVASDGPAGVDGRENRCLVQR